MWYFILFLFGIPVYIDGNVMDEMKERMQFCCDHGTAFAYNSTAEDCSSVKVPPDLWSFAQVCKYASEQCCQEYNIKKARCEKGIQLEQTKTAPLIMPLKENFEKNCFDQCKLGAKVGKSNGIASCKVTVRRESAEHLLFNDAFSKCCKAAVATDARDNPNNSVEKGFILDTPIVVSSMSSMCEEFPPHDLCAHNCVPVPGSYKCECNPGYALMSDGQSCEKVVNNRCDPLNTCQHECIDNGAEIKCSCKKGYELMADKSSCEDINECALGIHNCERDGDQYQCVNIPGSYRCVKHVNSLPTSLLKIEAKVYHTTTSEIITATPTLVVSPQTASTYITSEITTYRSQLPTLLEKPGNKIDDEQPGFISVNISKKFSANKTTEIIKEYEPLLRLESTESLENLPKSTETDDTHSEVTEVLEVPALPKLPILNINEKTASSQKLDDDSAKVNTEKVSKNESSQINETSSDCQIGFEMDSLGLCFDYDWGYPDQQITSRPDKKRNNCDVGYNFNSKIGKCEVYTPVAPKLAIKMIIPGTKGGKTFVEPEITQIEDRGSVCKCLHVDECAKGEALCGPLQVCTNLPGGYTCSCPAGHRLVGDHVCEDVDECALGGSKAICSQDADCINTVGSYQCQCHQGFKPAPINDKVCVDVDECTDSRLGTLCQHRCNNVWGGYRCSCHRGYRLNPTDNRTCTDVDECTEFKHKNLCIGRCINEPGSYRCSCPSGYTLSEDERSCLDINECETGEAPCATGGQYDGSSVVCLNTRGGYQCLNITCPPGYKLESRHRCTKIQTYCPPSDWACSHQPSTYSYNYITFVSNLYINESKVDLFTMKGPSWSYAKLIFELRVVDVDAPPSVKEADIDDFLLIQTGNQAVMSLVRPLEGPQSIELELSMELYSRGQFGGIAVAKLYIYVSEYEF